MTDRHINTAGLALIKEFEGLREAPASSPNMGLPPLSVGRGSRFLNRPASKDADVESARRDSVLLRHQRRWPTVRHLTDETPIVRLRERGRPSAIRRGVTLVVIPPLNRQIVSVAVAQRPISERLETLPVGADGYSTTAIGLVLCVGASRVHQFPDVVEPRSSRAMRPAALASNVSSETAARLCLALPEVGPKRHGLVSAVASTQPKRPATRRIPCLTKHSPSPMPRVGQVDEAGVFGHPEQYTEIDGGAICYG